MINVIMKLISISYTVKGASASVTSTHIIDLQQETELFALLYVSFCGMSL